MSSTSDTRKRKNSSVPEAIINCTCGSQEEYGLMVQCDICLCWQHGECNNMQEEADVPEKYVCTFCLNPPLERPGKKYSHSQDWLLSGKLLGLSVASDDEQEKEEYAEMLKTSHDLLSALIHLKKAVWATRVKVETLGHPDHPKLYQWNEKWDSYTEADTDDDNDDNEKNDETLVNVDDNTFDGRTVESVTEDRISNEDTNTDPVEEDESKNGNNETELTNVVLSLSSPSSTESVNGLPAVFEIESDLHTEDRCVPHETHIIEDAVSAMEFAVPEDENTGENSLSTEAGFMTTDSSICAQELSFMSPDAPFIYAGAKPLMGEEEGAMDEDFEVLSQTIQDLFDKEEVEEERKGEDEEEEKEQEEEEEEEKEELEEKEEEEEAEEGDLLLIDEESESFILKSLCETFDDAKSLSEIYSHSTEKHETYREESSLSDDLNMVDEAEIHDESSSSLIKQTEGEKYTATIIHPDTDEMGSSAQTGVDECSTTRKVLTNDHGMRVRTIKMDPRITVQLVENVPGTSVETEKNKSFMMLQAGNDKPRLRNDFGVSLESGRNESNAACHAGQSESEKDEHDSPVHAVKDKHDETVQPVRNKACTLFHSSESKAKVSAKVIKDQPFCPRVLSSIAVKLDIPHDITGTTKSVNRLVPQSKHGTTMQVVKHHNERTIDNVPCENSSSGEIYNNRKTSTNNGSESQCREQDSFTTISTNLSAQAGGNENRGDAGNDSPDSFDRILNALKTVSESVSCQENLSSDPDFESELAMLEETVHSIGSDSCGPSGLEQARNNSNSLGPLHLSVYPRANSLSVNDYGTVQYEALMDNANDAVVPNILNQSSEQQIRRVNPVNISAAPVVFEDLLIRNVESTHDREKSSETSDFQLPMDAAQILQLADSIEESLCSSDSEHHRRVPAAGPQPEALIETEVCRNHLAYHIAEEHKKLMQVLDDAEEKIKDLESKCMDENAGMRPVEVKRRMKKIIKILNLVNNLGKQYNVQAVKSVANSK